MSSRCSLERASPISHSIEFGDQIPPIHPPCLYSTGAARYEGRYTPRFGSSDEDRP